MSSASRRKVPLVHVPEVELHPFRRMRPGSGPGSPARTVRPGPPQIGDTATAGSSRPRWERRARPDDAHVRRGGCSRAAAARPAKYRRMNRRWRFTRGSSLILKTARSIRCRAGAWAAAALRGPPSTGTSACGTSGRAGRRAAVREDRPAVAELDERRDQHQHRREEEQGGQREQDVERALDREPDDRGKLPDRLVEFQRGQIERSDSHRRRSRGRASALWWSPAGRTAIATGAVVTSSCCTVRPGLALLASGPSPVAVVSPSSRSTTRGCGFALSSSSELSCVLAGFTCSSPARCRRQRRRPAHRPWADVHCERAFRCSDVRGR